MKIILLLMLVKNAVLIPFHSYSQQPGKNPQPNIVFIISDDHRWDAIGAAGKTKIKTPVLDKLARY